MTDKNKPQLIWEGIDSNVERSKVFGGWLVRSMTDVLVSMHEEMQPQAGYEWRESICFVPDINHEWGKPEKCKHENKVESKASNGLINKIICLDCGEILYEFNRPEVNTHYADTTKIGLKSTISK